MLIKNKNLKKVAFVAIISTALSSGFYSTSIAIEDGNQIKVESVEEYFNGERSNYSLDDLKNIRNSLVKKNYDIMVERVDNPESFEEYYDTRAVGKYGMHTFFRNNFKNLSEYDLLKKEIVFLEYINSTGSVIDPSYGYMPDIYSIYEAFLYEKHNGRDSLKSSKDMNTMELENLFEFYANNFENMSYEMNSNAQEIFELIYPSGVDGLSLEFEQSIQNRIKERAATIKSYIKSLKSEPTELDKKVLDICDKIEKAEISVEKAKIENISDSNYSVRASIRSKTLAYARKHGYKDEYDGEGPPAPYHDYSLEGGDCANFVSQCLHEGGIQFWTGNPPNNYRSWYFRSYGDVSDSWILAQNFREHWQMRVPSEYMYVKDSLSFLSPATPISLLNKDRGYQAYHTIIATDRHSNGYNFSYAAHTDGGKRTNLLYKLQQFRDIKYYKIGWQ